MNGPLPEHRAAFDYLMSLAQWSGAGGFSPDSIRKVVNYLSDPQDKVPSIHVAGTNGKGSVTSAVASILGAAGYHVGLTSSPHLIDINERILIDGYPVSDELLSSWAQVLHKASQETDVELSFFEAMMAIAFIGFSELSLDFSVIEVGLGGRFDASNVLTSPEVTVITSIDFDHEHILGNTLSKIAADKAGIIKPRVPVVIGKMGKRARSVIESIAADLNAPVYCYGRDFEIKQTWARGYLASGRYESSEGSGFELSPSLAGEHQLYNMSLAAKVAEIIGVSPEYIQDGVSTLFWPARLESIKDRGREIILDCAHNIAGVKSLIHYLNYRELRKVSLGVGVLSTKRWKKMLSLLAPWAEHCGVITPASDKAVPAEKVIAHLSGFGVSAGDFSSSPESFIQQELSRKTDSPIVFAGSMYMVGGIRDYLCIESQPVWLFKGKSVRHTEQKVAQHK